MDYFPTTQYTWIDEELGRGAEGRRALNTFLMEVYATPLRAYYLGSSMRLDGRDVDDVINGFFASCLDRPDFVTAWQSSKMRLRRWLMNGLWLHLRSERKRERQQGRRERAIEPDDDAAAPGDTSTLDTEFVQSLVQAAMDRARRQCEADGKAANWEAFLAFRVGHEKCEHIATRLGKEPGEVRVMIRRAGERFAQAVRDILARDGASPEEIDAEIRNLLGAAAHT